jgi:hypothetical protein
MKKKDVLAEQQESPRNPEWLAFEDIEREGGGYPKSGTLHVWKCVNRHGFREIVTMVGGRPRVRRSDWERWLETRRLGEVA